MAKVYINNKEVFPLGVQQIRKAYYKYSLQDKQDRPWFALALESGNRIKQEKDGK